MRATDALTRLTRNTPANQSSWTDEDRDYLHTIICALKLLEHVEIENELIKN